MRVLDPQSLTQHVDRLYRAAWSLCGSREDAEDLVQETFARVLSRPRVLHGDDDAYYLMRVLRNTFLTSRTGLERRNTSQQDEDGYEEAVVTYETPELAIMRQADTELVQAAISQLSPIFQEVLLLADIEEMKYQEVADTLAIPIGTVMSRLARARKQVREHIVSALGKKS